MSLNACDARSGQSIKVLVVEDEPILLMLAAEVVEEAGYHPIAVSNADEAIATLRTHDDIRIVFTDIRMPGSMDGIKLAVAIRDRWPPIDIIVTSGHLSSDPAGLPEGSVFFRKPYRTETIVEALHAFSR